MLEFETIAGAREVLSGERPTEQEMVELLRNPTPETRQQVVQHFLPIAMRAAIKVSHTSRYTADELLPAAFEGLVKAVESYDPDGGSLRLWLFCAARQYAQNYCRAEGAWNSRAEQAEITSYDLGLDSVSGVEARIHLEQTLDQQELELVALRAVAGLTLHEAGVQMGYTPASGSTWEARAQSGAHRSASRLWARAMAKVAADDREGA